MADFNKFNSFIEAVFEKKHDFSGDTLKLMLTNVAPVATNTQKSDLTEISAGSGYTAGGEALTVTSSSQTAGTYSCVITSDITWTNSGTIGPFRYAVAYNDTATNDELVGWWDYGSAITLSVVGDKFIADTGGATIISAS
jgi:hypothetical protein